MDVSFGFIDFEGFEMVVFEAEFILGVSEVGLRDGNQSVA
jgi:hypothetical protein